MYYVHIESCHQYATFFGSKLQISLSQNVHPLRSKERQLYSQATADRDYVF